VWRVEIEPMLLEMLRHSPRRAPAEQEFGERAGVDDEHQPRSCRSAATAADARLGRAAREHLKIAVLLVDA